MDGIDKKRETGRIKKGIRLDTRFMDQEIEVEVQQLDYGFEVRILGGQRSHIGAVTVADEQGNLQTIVLPGHKEDVITRQWAAQIQDMVKEPVSVLAGVHYDDLEKSQLLDVIHVLDDLFIKCKEILAGMIREERMEG